MFQKNTSGEARVGARDGYNRIVSPHVRLFPHKISENPSYSLPSTIRCTIAHIGNIGNIGHIGLIGHIVHIVHIVHIGHIGHIGNIGPIGHIEYI